MQRQRFKRLALLLGLAILASSASVSAVASGNPVQFSGKLLLTQGVSSISGAAGGGLTPWALIGGYDDQDQIGANAFYSHLNTQDYSLDDYGAMIGIHNRVEFSIAQQSFDTQDVGAALGLGRGFTIKQRIYGVKVRLFGDAVLGQDSWVPQVSVGAQYKKNNQGAVLHAIGAKKDSGTDVYISATKLYLQDDLLLNATVRLTKANQVGILGFGGDKNDSYKPEFAGSVAYLLTRKLAIGAEYRMKPNNLGIAKEDNWYDAFAAYTFNKNISFTLAYVHLGTVVIKKHQGGLFASVQVGF